MSESSNTDNESKGQENSAQGSFGMLLVGIQFCIIHADAVLVTLSLTVDILGQRVFTFGTSVDRTIQIFSAFAALCSGAGT